jgi:hypothetical protein
VDLLTLAGSLGEAMSHLHVVSNLNEHHSPVSKYSSNLFAADTTMSL